MKHWAGVRTFQLIDRNTIVWLCILFNRACNREHLVVNICPRNFFVRRWESVHESSAHSTFNDKRTSRCHVRLQTLRTFRAQWNDDASADVIDSLCTMLELHHVLCTKTSSKTQLTTCLLVSRYLYRHRYRYWHLPKVQQEPPISPLVLMEREPGDPAPGSVAVSTTY